MVQPNLPMRIRYLILIGGLLLRTGTHTQRRVLARFGRGVGIDWKIVRLWAIEFIANLSARRLSRYPRPYRQPSVTEPPLLAVVLALEPPGPNHPPRFSNYTRRLTACSAAAVEIGCGACCSPSSSPASWLSEKV